MPLARALFRSTGFLESFPHRSLSLGADQNSDRYILSRWHHRRDLIYGGDYGNRRVRYKFEFKDALPYEADERPIHRVVITHKPKEAKPFTVEI